MRGSTTLQVAQMGRIPGRIPGTEDPPSSSLQPDSRIGAPPCRCCSLEGGRQRVIRPDAIYQVKLKVMTSVARPCGGGGVRIIERVVRRGWWMSFVMGVLSSRNAASRRKGSCRETSSREPPRAPRRSRRPSGQCRHFAAGRFHCRTRSRDDFHGRRRGPHARWRYSMDLALRAFVDVAFVFSIESPVVVLLGTPCRSRGRATSTAEEPKGRANRVPPSGSISTTVRRGASFVRSFVEAQAAACAAHRRESCNPSSSSQGERRKIRGMSVTAGKSKTLGAPPLVRSFVRSLVRSTNSDVGSTATGRFRQVPSRFRSRFSPSPS